MLAARRAGIQIAAAPVTSNRSMTPKNAAGSQGSTPAGNKSTNGRIVKNDSGMPMLLHTQLRQFRLATRSRRSAVERRPTPREFQTPAYAGARHRKQSRTSRAAPASSQE